MPEAEAQTIPARKLKSMQAREKRVLLAKKAKAKGKKTFRVRSTTKTEDASKVAKQTSTKKAVAKPVAVSRMGRIKNMILRKVGLRDLPKTKKLGIVLTKRKTIARQLAAKKRLIEKEAKDARKKKEPYEAPDLKEVKKHMKRGVNLRQKTKSAPRPQDPSKNKKKQKKEERKKETAKRIAEEEAAKKSVVRKPGDITRKPKRSEMMKRVADRRATALAKLAKAGKKPTKKAPKKKFEFRKADGTAKKRSDPKTRLAKIALREQVRRRHPKVRESYPTTDIAIAEKKPVRNPKVCKLREGLKPGTVCIVLAGVNKGKRVIFLKQLPSGLCLVNGPLALNRVPMRRIAQCFLLATSTRIHLPKLPIKHIDDSYFARQKLTVQKKKEGDMFDSKKSYYRVSAQRKKDQKKVDFFIMKFINNRKDHKTLRAYLATKFLLGNHDYPHAMKF